jgi:hypothetical protein
MKSIIYDCIVHACLEITLNFNGGCFFIEDAYGSSIAQSCEFIGQEQG